jgi:phosphate-selective porin OprO and OprP
MLFMRASTIFLLLGTLFFTVTATAQTADDILRLMVKKGAISGKEADSLRGDYAARRHREEAAADSFPLRLGRSLILSGYSQAIYANYQRTLAGKYADGFSIKRARLDFQGRFSSRFDYRLLVDFVGQSGSNGTAPTGGQLISPFLVEANITYKPFDFLDFKAGQMIVAFSQENITQDRNMDLIERSQVVNALAGRKGDAASALVDSLGNQNGRDIGIQVHGSLIRMQDTYLLDYFVQLLDGAGINTLDNNPSKDIDARLVLHPFKHLSLGGSWYDGTDRFTGSTSKDQKRSRWGAELALNYERFSVKGEYIKGQEGSSALSHPQGGSGLTLHEGWYGQAGFFVLPRKLQAVFRYDRYDPNTAKDQVKSVFYDFGLNYFFNVWTKLQLYYSLRNQQGVAVNNNLFEAQLQLAF